MRNAVITFTLKLADHQSAILRLPISLAIPRLLLNKFDVFLILLLANNVSGFKFLMVAVLVLSTRF